MAPPLNRDVFAAWRRWAPPFAATIVIMTPLSVAMISPYYWPLWGSIGAIVAVLTSVFIHTVLAHSARETKLRLFWRSGVATIAMVLACLLLYRRLSSQPVPDPVLNNLCVFLYVATFCGSSVALTALWLSFVKEAVLQPRVMILFLAANPRLVANPQKKLEEDVEYRDLKEALRSTDYRDQFHIEPEFAALQSKLTEHLLRYRPDIVHFSGHGLPSAEIVFEDEERRSQPVSADDLRRIFAILKDRTRLVVLNACYTDTQAAAIAESVDCVIGSTGPIGDRPAIGFAKTFYKALGYGKSVLEAFQLSEIHLKEKVKILDPHKRAESLVFATAAPEVLRSGTAGSPA